ncbi:MAG: hypothetical protein QM662_11540 [Gordonia sp. (in: high G+C Gram-positive bacteria)]
MGVDTVQGYGSRRRQIAMGILAAVGVVIVSGSATACSLLADDGNPSPIVVPPQDQLTTESEPASSVSSSSSRAQVSDEADELPDWSIGRVISLAPRADNSRYHQGSIGPDSPLEDTSGFHFSTPDRRTLCSTGTAGRTPLVCRFDQAIPAARYPTTATASSCEWSANLVRLDANGAQAGACANEFPVLYRSSIVDFGTTIAIGRFACLVDTDGLYCLQSTSDSGFALTSAGYRAILSSERAPGSLIGLPESTETDTGEFPTSTTPTT